MKEKIPMKVREQERVDDAAADDIAAEIDDGLVATVNLQTVCFRFFSQFKKFSKITCDVRKKN